MKFKLFLRTAKMFFFIFYTSCVKRTIIYSISVYTFIFWRQLHISTCRIGTISKLTLFFFTPTPTLLSPNSNQASIQQKNFPFSFTSQLLSVKTTDTAVYAYVRRRSEHASHAANAELLSFSGHSHSFWNCNFITLVILLSTIIDLCCEFEWMCKFWFCRMRQAPTQPLWYPHHWCFELSHKPSSSLLSFSSLTHLLSSSSHLMWLCVGAARTLLTDNEGDHSDTSEIFTAIWRQIVFVFSYTGNNDRLKVLNFVLS